MNFKHVSLIASVGFAALLSGASSALAATAPPLGTTQGFAVLGGSTVTSTGSSVITGDLGVWPGLAITGFPPGTVSGTTHAGDAVALQAQSDLVTAYNNLAGQACDSDLTGQDLGGMTLTPGTYCYSTAAQLTGTLTLNAQGDPNAVFVFQIGSTLTTASSSSVVVINTGQSCKVFWQVGSSATLGTGTAFAGNILALTSITLNTGANMTGRALARNGAVTLDTNNVNASTCATTCPPITVNPATLPSGGQPAVPYTATFTATGGKVPYTFAVTSGSLPPGSPAFTLTSAGVLSGTPTASGTSTFTITATDANGCTGLMPYTLTINAASCPALTIAPATLPNAVLGSPYSQPITASGSTPDSYTYAVTAGSLPPGLGLSPVTAIKTVTLAGTATTAGIFSFTITATDANGCQVSQAYSTLVVPAGSNIPTLSRWAMVLLVGLLALAGVVAIRRMT
jgi:Ice-binding-like/Putative Ig domain/IPTL-CTERM motif